MNRLLRTLERPAAVPLIVGGAMVAIWALRVAFLDGLGGDEAEQVLFAQSLQWGYDTANPPLYTWVLVGLFSLFGKSVPLVLAFKFTVLGAVYIALHGTARRALGADRELEASLAALSPVLLFYVGWYGLFSYSHSLLNALFVILTFRAALVVTEDAGWKSYGVLGVVVGLGMLTKYSYGLFVLGLLVSALSLSETRPRVLSPRLLLSSAVALAVFAPHGLWLLANAGALQDALTYKLEIDVATPWLTGVGQGLASLGRALVAFLSPFMAFQVLLFPAILWPNRSAAARPLASPLLGRAFAVVIALMAAMVLAGGVTHFRGNYLFLLVLIPLWAFARIAPAAGPDWRYKAYAGVVIGAVALSVGAMAVKPVSDALRCRKCQELVPYATLAEELKGRGFTGGTLFASWYPIPLPGNLALFLDEARVISAKFPDIRPPHRAEPGQCLLVWSPLEAGGTDRAGITAWARRSFGTEVPPGTPVTRLELPMNGNPDRKIPIDFMRLDPGNGDCR